MAAASSSASVSAASLAKHACRAGPTKPSALESWGVMISVTSTCNQDLLALGRTHKVCLGLRLGLG